MRPQATSKVKWKPATSQGGLGREVEFEMLNDDLEAMRTLWSEAAAEPDSERRARLVAEVRLQMDIFALFPLTVIVREPTPALATEARARTSDPETSHQAAASLSPEVLRATQQAVLACLRENGPMHHEALCDVYEETRHINGWPQQSVSGIRTRTHELVEGGLVIRYGHSVLPSGRRTIVWRAK